MEYKYLEKIEETLVQLSKSKVKTIFLIDDADKSPEKFFDIFSGLRDFLWRTNAVFVVAGDRYSKNNLFSDASDRVFDDIIKMPKINREGIIKIMGKRIKAIDEKRSHKDVFNEESVDIIFNYYNRTHDLREALRLCKESITKAVDDNLDIVPALIVANCLMEKIR
jgi:hypothetical protein